MIIIIIMMVIIVFIPTYMIAYDKGYWKGKNEAIDDIENLFNRH